jgi:hypothetical protein
MTVNKGTKEIRALLDELAKKKKTDRDRLSVLSTIKLLIECMEEPLKKRRDKKKASYDAKTRIIKKALKQFLTALDNVYTRHEEVGDSDVRDQMYAAIFRSFIQPQQGYSLPAKFGMFSDQGNKSVHMALRKFLTHPEVLAASRALKSPEDRFAAFQDGDVQTSEDTNCFEYFGYSNKVRAA